MSTAETNTPQTAPLEEGSPIDPMKLWILLDRSGSMGLLQEAVIQQTNHFLRSQRSEPGECRLTLAQFDSQDPFEVVVDDTPIGSAPELNAAIYRPRGTTPLYDAIGTLISRADQRLEQRDRDGLDTEDQTILIFTDGLENASSDFDRSQIRRLIKEREQRGWQFVYMGANQDSYEESIKIGITVENTADWVASPAGVHAAMASNSERLLARRRMSRDARAASPWFSEEPPASRTASN